MAEAEEPELADIRARYLALLIAGDRHAAIREAVTLLERGIPLDRFVLDVLAPAQHLIGLRWQGGQISTAHERLATEVADLLLTLAAARRPKRAGGAKLVMCVADREHHNLPARMVAELLRDQGHAVTFLGAARPQPQLGALLERMRPDALVASCSLTMNLPGLPALAEAAHEHGLPVVGGGAGFGGDASRAPRVGIDAHAATVGRVAESIGQVADGGLQPPPQDDRAMQHADLVTSRTALTSELTDRLLWRTASLLPRVLRAARPLRPHIANFLCFLEAATLVDDRVLVDYAAWMQARMVALRADPAMVPTLLATPRDRLAADAPVAAQAANTALTA